MLRALHRVLFAILFVFVYYVLFVIFASSSHNRCLWNIYWVFSKASLRNAEYSLPAVPYEIFTLPNVHGNGRLLWFAFEVVPSLAYIYFSLLLKRLSIGLCLTDAMFILITRQWISASVTCSYVPYTCFYPLILYGFLNSFPGISSTRTYYS